MVGHGHISLMNVREWSLFTISIWSLFCSGNGVVPGLTIHFALRQAGIFFVMVYRRWGRALDWGNSFVPRTVFEHRNSSWYVCLSETAVSQSCCSQYSTLNPV